MECNVLEVLTSKLDCFIRITNFVLLIRIKEFAMSKRCQITGKTVMSGNNVSHANNRTRRKFLPNLQITTMESEILGRKLKLRVSTSAIRTVEKHGGIDTYLIQAKNSELAKEARALKSEILAIQKN